jgi:hypothetical protein
MTSSYLDLWTSSIFLRGLNKSWGPSSELDWG